MRSRSRRILVCLLTSAALSLGLGGTGGAGFAAIAHAAGPVVPAGAAGQPTSTRVTGTKPGAVLSPGRAPSHRAPSGRAGKTDANGSAPCFGDTFPDCASTDPDVSFSLYSNGDTSDCTFSDQISWADGSEQTVQLQGADNAPQAVATHTYEQLGGYGITDVVTVVSGDCTASDGEYTFAYVTGSPRTPTQQWPSP